MQLSRHFSLMELARSETADAHRIREQYPPPDNAIANLRALAENVLEPAREALGEAILVTSGYRCPALNHAVGSADTSDHIRGKAADLKARDMLGLWKALSRTPFKQLIWYYEDEAVPEFIHVSFDAADVRREVKKCYLEADENGVERRHYRRAKV